MTEFVGRLDSRRTVIKPEYLFQWTDVVVGTYVPVRLEFLGDPLEMTRGSGELQEEREDTEG